MSVCVDEVLLWMASNRLLLNPAKTEVLWCSSARRQYQIPSDSVRIGNTSVVPVSVVGVYIDADLMMSAESLQLSTVSQHSGRYAARGIL